jgi:hypothetical protein
LNVFLFLPGPEGLGRKNFEIETQCSYKRARGAASLLINLLTGFS